MLFLFYKVVAKKGYTLVYIHVKQNFSLQVKLIFSIVPEHNLGRTFFPHHPTRPLCTASHLGCPTCCEMVRNLDSVHEAVECPKQEALWHGVGSQLGPAHHLVPGPVNHAPLTHATTHTLQWHSIHEIICA